MTLSEFKELIKNANHETRLIIYHDDLVTTCIVSNIEIFSQVVKISIYNENFIEEKIIFFSNIKEIEII